MNLGPLNRKGILYRNDPTAGDGGAPVDNLTALRNLPLTVWGEDAAGDDAKDATIGSRISQDVDTVWLTRWFEGLEANMFMIFEGTTFRITRRKELGRREGWQIWAQVVR